MGQAEGKTQKVGSRYPRELVLRAIQAVNEGATLTTVAKDFKVAPNVVKYWVDNADRFMGPAGMKALTFGTGLDDHTRQQFHRIGWQSVYLALRVARVKFKTATLTEISTFIANTVDRLGKHARPTDEERRSGDGGESPIKSAASREAGRAFSQVEAMVVRMTQQREGPVEEPQGEREEPIDATTPTPAEPEPAATDPATTTDNKHNTDEPPLT